MKNNAFTPVFAATSLYIGARASVSTITAKQSVNNQRRCLLSKIAELVYLFH